MAKIFEAVCLFRLMTTGRPSQDPGNALNSTAVLTEETPSPRGMGSFVFYLAALGVNIGFWIGFDF